MDLENLNLNYTKKTYEIKSFQTDVIDLELLNDKSLVVCNETSLILVNLDTSLEQNVFSNKSNDLSCLKQLTSNNLLFAANDTYLHVFDINANLKQLSKYKFCKDTINSIEFNSNTQIGLCDDSGEIKIVDLRTNNLNLVIKNKLNGHSNICSTIKFAKNGNELLSGSFDCTLLKWDLRSPKTFTSKINISDVLNKDNLISAMTPNFVHKIHLWSNNHFLIGIENGLCLAFDLNSFKYLCSEQIQSFNCALTQLVDLNDKICGCGNGQQIEFFSLNLEEDLLKFNKKEKINHKNKINSAKCLNEHLFIGDTSNQLTIYDFIK